MKITTIATQKGGAGKTTLATNLAVTAAQAGLSVLIIDADNQKTALDWFNKRDNQDNPIVMSADSKNQLETLLEKAEQIGIERIFIDTQGSDTNLVNSAISRADFVLIPCGAGGFDITAQKTTAEAVLLLKKSAAFVITKVNKRSSGERDTRMVLNGMGIAVCEHTTTYLKIYQDSSALYNSTVLEQDPSSAAAAEIKKLYSWLESKLTSDNKLLNAMRENNDAN